MIRIMIVEDEPPILRDIAALVRSLSSSFDVCAQAYNAHAAMEHIKNDVPDVVITDINMPAISGLDLIQWISENHYDCIPVILSGFNEFEYAKRAMSMGVNYYIMKPVDEEELAGVLRKVESDILLSKREQRRLLYESLIEQSGATNQDKSLLCHAPHIILALCLGSFPSSYLGDYPLRKKLWKDINPEALLENQLGRKENLWVFNGKNPAVKIAVISFPDRDYLKLDQLLNSIKKQPDTNGIQHNHRRK